MTEKKITNHVLALKQALARKQAAAHPDAENAGQKTQPGRAPMLANKPQKRVTGRGR